MELILLNKRLMFHNVQKVSNSDPNNTTKRGELMAAPLTLRYVPDGAGDFSGIWYHAKSFQTAVMKFLCGMGREVKWDWMETRRIRLTVDLTVTSKKTANVKIFARKGDIKDLPGYQLFERLRFSALPPASYELNLNLKLDLNYTKFEVKGKNLEIKLFEGKGYGLDTTGMEVTEEMWSAWESTRHVDHGKIGDPDDHDRDRHFDIDMDQDFSKKFDGEITLTLRLDHSAVTKLYLGTLASTETLWPRNLIIEGVPSDLVILAGGEKDKEKGIKCHKKILSESSQVFTAMFQADKWTESKDNCLEIVDMTEAGVWAMLQFIYARDLEEASKKCEIAVELLEGGQRYGMEDLSDIMRQLIWAKPVEWMTVDSASKLLQFSRKTGGKIGWMTKTCLAILKRYGIVNVFDACSEIWEFDGVEVVPKAVFGESLSCYGAWRDFSQVLSQSIHDPILHDGLVML